MQIVFSLPMPIYRLFLTIVIVIVLVLFVQSFKDNLAVEKDYTKPNVNTVGIYLLVYDYIII